MSDVTIYHNPRCSKSRETLHLLRDEGIEPKIIEYVNNPPSITELKEILSLLEIPASKLLRKKDPAYLANGLDNENTSEDKIIQAMSENPGLIERPIVITQGKAVLGRPPENIYKLLEEA